MFRSLNASLTLPSSKLLGGPTRTLLGGSESTFGYMKRVVPPSQAAMVAINAAQATANGEGMNLTTKVRRASPFFGGAAAGWAGMGGLAGAAAAGGAADGAAGCGAGVAGSAITSEPSRTSTCHGGLGPTAR